MSDYIDDIYERYMLTGEGAEYFEDYTKEETEDFTEEEETEIVAENRDLDAQLDDVIRMLKQQIKEKERLIKKEQQKKKKKKKEKEKAKTKKE